MGKKNLVTTKIMRNAVVSDPVSPNTIGRLSGPFADMMVTANNHDYAEAWRAALKSADVKDMLKRKVMYMALDHPEGIEDSKARDAAASVVSLVERDGIIWGEADILPTAEGKHLKILLDYGSVLGVSSRGAGETYIDESRNVSVVVPESYELFTFDIVTRPACEVAKPDYITESVVKELGKQPKLTFDQRKQLLEDIREVDNISDLNIFKAVVANFGLSENKQIKALLEERDAELSVVLVEDGDGSVITVDDEGNVEVSVETVGTGEVVDTEDVAYESVDLLQLIERINGLEKRIVDLESRLDTDVVVDKVVGGVSESKVPVTYGYAKLHTNKARSNYKVSKKYRLNEGKISNIRNITFEDLGKDRGDIDPKEVERLASLFTPEE